VLRSVAGISISYDRNYSYLGMRGLSRPGDYNTRVLVLIDGHRANDNVEDMATLGTDFQLDVELIDRIEVIRGPSAALYGSSAFAAVINVVTRQGHHVDGVETSVGMSSFNTRHGRLTWGKQYARRREFLLSGSVYRSDGPAQLFFPEFNGPGGDSGYASRADGDSSNTLALAATLGSITIHGVSSSRTKQVPTASFNTVFNSGLEQTIDERDFLDAQYTKEVGRSTDVLGRLYLDRYSYDGFYPYPSSPGADNSALVMNRDFFHGIWWGSEFDVSHRVRRAHRVTAGTEFRQNLDQSTLNYDQAPHSVYIDSRPRTYAFAVNLQDEYTVTNRLLLNIAAREERVATGATGFTPKIGFILTPQVNTTAKLLFSRALRAPSAYELYYDSPANAGNALLNPERTQYLELNVEHFLSPSVKIAGSVYHNQYRDLIVGVAGPAGAVVLQNGLDAHADGLELTWHLQRSSGLQARASYSTLFDRDAASKRVDQRGPEAPREIQSRRAGAAARRESGTRAAVRERTAHAQRRHPRRGGRRQSECRPRQCIARDRPQLIDLQPPRSAL
jgi:outer membrane receptor for ferrienterochelin and colicins